MPDRLAYTVPQLALAVGKSEKYIRDCIRTDGTGKLVPLKAKRDGKGYLITRKAAEAWLDQHKDA